MLSLHTYVEPIVFFTCACFYSYLTIESQFVYQFVSESYNFTKDESVYYCRGINNDTISASEQAQIVADEVSRWTKLGSVLRSVASSISVLVITSWSDVIGRRNALFFPVIGALISSTMLLINIHFRISLVLYVIISVIYGAAGGWSALINVGSAHLSDIIATEDRGHRYTLLEISGALDGGLVQIGTGYWVSNAGFESPTLFLIGCSVVALLLTIFLKTRNPQLELSFDEAEAVDSRVTDEKKKKTRSMRSFVITIGTQLREVLRIYTSNNIKCNVCDEEGVECAHCDRSKNRVWRLWMYLITYVIYMAAVDGFDLFMTMFLVSFPLCFTPDLVGIQTGLESTVMVFSPLVLLLFRTPLKFSVQGSLLWAMLGRIATSCFMFFATSPVFVFIGTSFGVLGNLTTPFIRVQVSNLVSPSEQGPALALIPSLSNLANIISPLVILSIYTATLHIRYSFIWAVLALYFVVAFSLMSAVWIADKIREHRNKLNG